MDLLEALDKLSDPLIILEKIKKGFDRTLKISYWDTLHDNQTKTYVTIHRYKTIENIILDKYYLCLNDSTLETKIIEQYKQKYKITLTKMTSTIVKKKTGTIVKKVSRAEEKQEHNQSICRIMNERVHQYCDIFKINLQELLERGEEYPDVLRP